MAQFIVSNLENSGAGSFRQAIESANTQPGKDEIVFDNSLRGGEITLTSGQLNITDSLQITGLGADSLTISGNNTNRVFSINDGSDDLIQVEITDLTIAEGFRSFRGTGDGAGIDNFENLTLSNSIIADNFAQEGGAGISNRGTIDLIDSAVINNVVGGGIVALGGGGIYNDGTATIINSTIASNEGNELGGGIANRSNLEIFNSTITGNAIATNVSNRSGAGIYNSSNSGLPNGSAEQRAIATITSSIVAGNNNNDLGGGLSSQSNFNSGGNNLIGNADGADGFSNGVNGDIVGTAANPIDPLLGTLQNNGGTTPTIALLTGSPAIDAGSNPLSLNTDQRGAGFPRTEDGNGDGVAVTDIGAFEADSASNAPNGGEIIIGTNDADSLVGGAGNDELFGGRGFDSLIGNDGNDTLNGGNGSDKLYGSAGNDELFGDSGKDFLVGGSGNDFIDGGNGSDTLVGGLGEDGFVIRNQFGQDNIIDYSDGSDLFVLADGLTFGQLNIVERNNSTEIRLVDSDLLLTRVSLVSIEAIDESDFVTS
jgi:Ca2+-binding RTX toxin-like protein